MAHRLVRSALVLAPLSLGLLGLGCELQQPDGLSGVTATSGAGVGSTGAGKTTTSSSGSGGDGGTGGSLPMAAFSIAVDNTTPSVVLADSVVLGVTLEPNGYSGNVDLSVDSSLLANVTAEFGQTSLTLNGTSSANTTLTLTSATSSNPGALSFKVHGIGGGKEKTASATLTVLSDLTITIPPNVDSMMGTSGAPNKNAFGPYPITVKAPAGISAANPVTVRFFNNDTVSHEIHGSNPNAGFPHDNAGFAGGSMDPMVREVNAAGTYDFYLHDEGGPFTVGRLVIQ